MTARKGVAKDQPKPVVRALRVIMEQCVQVGVDRWTQTYQTYEIPADPRIVKALGEGWEISGVAVEVEVPPPAALHAEVWDMSACAAAGAPPVPRD